MPRSTKLAPACVRACALLALGAAQTTHWPAALAAPAAVSIAASTVAPNASAAAPSEGCAKPVYLTFDTGSMQTAPLIADILNKHQVKVTFFVANEKTKDGSSSLARDWGEKFWAARGKEGHEFASHTWDHLVWVRDAAGANFSMRPTQGPHAGKTVLVQAKQYCEQLDLASTRITQYTQQKALPLFRAPAGKTSPQLLAAAKNCGYLHVGWTSAGFLGDELPSDRFPNAALLHKALRDIRSGDVLLAHLGIWSRQDPWAPAVLEPLIVGLKNKGYCFQTLRHHPAYKNWITQP